ncbi:MAG: ABC transporter permease [Acidimicrobiales bacterium]
MTARTARRGGPGAGRGRVSPLVVRALERELLLYRRTWRGSAVSVFVQPVLYLLALGLGLGGLVGDVGAGDGTYLAFVAPGVLASMAMLGSAGDSLWGVMGATKWLGVYRSMVNTAMVPGDLFAGRVLYVGVRTAIGAVVFVAMAAAVGGATSPFAVLAVVPAVLMAMTSSAWLSAYSVRQDDDSTFPLVLRLGVLPLFMFSGTFFPVQQLPGPVQPLVWLSPLWHAVEPARDLMSGTVSGATALHLGILLVLLAAAVPVGARGFADRLTP